MKWRHTVRASGFTIVEVIVVISVFAVGVAMLASLMSSIQQVQRNAQYMDIATRAARAEIERLRTVTFTSITNGAVFTSNLPTTLPPGSTGTIAVTIPTNAPLSKQVDATVSYPLGTSTKQVTISAYIDSTGGT